jgi:succinate-semialdehyde dehydrogenase/glutarate-semialdehyde dehydrogenase
MRKPSVYPNDGEFGLASYFYSRDVGRIWRVAAAIESGMVGINTG